PTTGQSYTFSQRQSAGQIGALFPFSRFERLEFGPIVRLTSVDYDNNAQPSFNAQANGLFVSYVYDKIERAFIEPISGVGLRATIEDFEPVFNANQKFLFYDAKLQSYWGLGKGLWRESVVGVNL